MSARESWREDERYALTVGTAEIVLEHDRSGPLPRSLNVYAAHDLSDHEAGALVGCLRDEDAMRDLRDALSALLGEPPAYDLAAAEAKGYSRGKADGVIAGVEHADTGRVMAQLVTAAEVEIFREAWGSAEPGNRIRSGLTAVESYRAWRAAA